MTRPVGNMRPMTEHLVATSPTRQFAPLAIIFGIPLLFAAIFFYTTPIMIPSGGAQGIFKCGSPSSPNSDAKNVCQEPESVGKNKALYSGLSGLALVGLGAVWMLRGQRDDEEEWDEGSPRRRPRRGDDDDIDLRAGTGERDKLRGPDRSRVRETERTRSRAADDVTPDEVEDVDEDADDAQTRSSRRSSGKRRAVLRDDDFGESSPPRRKGDSRKDDDWDSDGWR